MSGAAAKLAVKLTANFERDLAVIEAFYAEAGTARGYGIVIDELLDTVIPNLERFPGMGRPFLARKAGSVEVVAAQAMLRTKSAADQLREYVLKTTIVLYLHSGGVIHLLAIKHQRQLSFDFENLWVSRNR